MNPAKNRLSIGIILILAAATLSSLGQLAWKIGGEASNFKMFSFYGLGFIAAGAGMFVMMAAFRFGQVSILQPMMSVGFALSIILGAVFLDENITSYKLIGTALIIIGSILLGIEGNEEMK